MFIYTGVGFLMVSTIYYVDTYLKYIGYIFTVLQVHFYFTWVRFLIVATIYYIDTHLKYIGYMFTVLEVHFYLYMG